MRNTTLFYHLPSLPMWNIRTPAHPYSDPQLFFPSYLIFFLIEIVLLAHVVENTTSLTSALTLLCIKVR